MAFGQELKDFVGGFQAGYKMVDSPDEKKRKKAEEDRKQGTYDRTEEHYQQGRADDAIERTHRAAREGVADKHWETNQAWTEFQGGENAQRDERNFEADQTERDRVHEERLRADKLKYAEHAGSDDGTGLGGALKDGLGQDAAPPTSSAPTAVPDPNDQSSLGSESPRYRDPMVAQASYTGDTAIPDARSGNGLARATNASYGNPRTGPEIATQMVSDLQRDFKISPQIAVGIVGQLAGETSGFTQLQELNPTVPGSRGGGGYAQWTGPRRDAFDAFAGDNDKNSYQVNYQFLRNELANTAEGGVLDKLKGAPDAQTAGRIFTDNFLRPGTPNYAGRANWTNMVGRAAAKAGLLDQGQPTGKRMVTSAAVGGLMTGPEEEQQADQAVPAPAPVQNAPVPQPRPEEQAQALPVDGPVPAPRPDYAGTSEGNKEPFTSDAWEAGRRAVRDGMHRAIEQTGANIDSAIDDPALERARQNYLKGYGAAPAQMMKQVLDTIDPDKKLGPAERNMKAIGTVYQYYDQKGDQAKAKEAAASMVQYYRQSSQQFLALSKAAALNGDYDNAAKAAVAAYTNIPNGRDISITKQGDGYLIDVTDGKTGKTVHKQVVSPEEFGAAAAQFNPSTFDEEIMRAAGQTPEDFKHQTSENTEKTQGSINDYLDQSEGVTDPTTGAAGVKLSPAIRKVVSSAALDIAGNQTNSDSSETAVDFVQDMLSFNKNDKADDSAKYTIAKVPGNKDYKRVTMNGETKVMSTGELNKIEAARKHLIGERGTAREETAKDDQAAAKRRELYNKALGELGVHTPGATSEPASDNSVSAAPNRADAYRQATTPQAIPDDRPYRRSGTGGGSSGGGGF